MTDIHRLDVGDIRKARRNWKDRDYPEEISEICNPTTLKWKMIKYYYRISPFTSVSQQIDLRKQRDSLQSDIVESLDDLEHEVGEFQELLKEWKNTTGDKK